MRLFLRMVVGLLSGIALFMVVALAWLYFSTSGLPDIASLHAYAPPVAQAVPAARCQGATQALSVSDLRPLYPALFAAEGFPDRTRLFVASLSGKHDSHEGHYSIQIARSMLCTPQKPLRYQLTELRLALQMQRQFSEEELLTIYLNRVYFGKNMHGALEASQSLFGLSPERLDTAQAALLMGLISRPAYYSPQLHPDRAVARRNEVLERMNLGANETAVEEAKALEIR